MNQEQLNPYHSNHYCCDNCQREFRRIMAYSLNSSLEMNYRGDCVIENELEDKIQQAKRERSYSVVSEIAKMQGIIETQKEENQYLRPTSPLSQTNKTHLITQLKTKQTLTPEEINQINNYLKAKQAFLQARQETIEELQQFLNAFEKKLGKHNKISEVGNIVDNVGGTTSGVITFGIPQAVGDVIKSSNNFSKVKHAKKNSEESQNTLG